MCDGLKEEAKMMMERAQRMNDAVRRDKTMKTLTEAFEEHRTTRDSAHVTEHSAFIAGAAAMAELFACGQGLKLSSDAPMVKRLRRYVIAIWFENDTQFTLGIPAENDDEAQRTAKVLSDAVRGANKVKRIDTREVE